MSAPANTSTFDVRDTIRLGFVPLVDAAPAIVAKELGFFEQRGLRVRVERQPGWATVRDKMVHGELECAHALAGLAFAATYGLGCVRRHCIAGMVFNLHGNAVTLSPELYEGGIRTVEAIAAAARDRRNDRPLTFGIVSRYSTHHFLLQYWLRPHGIIPGRDVVLEVLPPQLMARGMRQGHLDGFCVGEPWNTIAVREASGWIVVRSADIYPHHPEKILLARNSFVRRRREEMVQLIASLLEACRFCQDPKNVPELARILARPGYLDVPAEIISNCLTAQFDRGYGDSMAGGDTVVFHGLDVNAPLASYANWTLSQMRFSELLPDGVPSDAPPVEEIYRSDLYEEALALKSNAFAAT